MRKILIVDDDQKTRVLLKTYLEKHNYEVILAQDGATFQAEFLRRADELSLVILDLMLPDTDGLALCKVVRQRSNVPIVMLTAISDETDRIVGLEVGADDYIAKPCSPRELVARIKALLRRAGVSTAPAPRTVLIRVGCLPSSFRRSRSLLIWTSSERSSGLASRPRVCSHSTLRSSMSPGCSTKYFSNW